MMTLITGQPGNGKTLFTLGLVEELRQKENREVYYHGIPELTLPWTLLEDPNTWYQLPTGSIVLIDEVFKIWPGKDTGLPKPGPEALKAIEEMATHRHLGIDMFLIAQHPQLVNIAVRKLIGRHYHLVRTFGQEVAKVRQWERAVDPNDRSVQSLAIQSTFKYPKERYTWYKSAEVHTVRKELPWRKLAVLAGSVLGVIGLGAFAASRLASMGEVEEPETLAGVPTASDYSPSQGATRAGFVPENFKPLVDLLPWSAPFYQPLADLEVAPRVAGCMELRKGSSYSCRCFDQQGADLGLSLPSCRAVMRKGIFDPTKPTVDVKAENIAYLNSRDQAGQQVASDSGEPRTRSNAEPIQVGR